MTKLCLISLGCSKNLVDAETMLGILKSEGYKIISKPETADVLIVNTCGFIDSAKEESINTILEMANYKKGACRLLIVTGCLAQRYSDDILKEMPEVDAIVGVGDYALIAEIIKKAEDGERISCCSGMGKAIPENLPRLVSTPTYTAYLKIAEGCDNRCTYCSIPSIRGSYKSREMEAILKEAKELVIGGAKELIVIAQDTTRYGLDLYGKKRLAQLLREICKIDDLVWVRVHYLYPEAVDDELIKVFKEEKKIVKYMDLPIQHANDEILRRMGRHTSKAQITGLMKKLREAIPEIAIRTSLIAGFPGETKEQFNELLEFVKEMKFDRLGAFPYSQEEGTPAALLPHQIDEDVKQDRYEKLMEAQKEVSKELAEKSIGESITVLVEGFEDYLYFGRSYRDSVDIDPKVYFGAKKELSEGDFACVKILACEDYDLLGEMQDE